MKYIFLLGAITFALYSIYSKEFLGISGWLTAAGLFFVTNFLD